MVSLGHDSAARGSALPGGQEPWPLQLFDRALKKRQKLDLLIQMAGPFRSERCLLVTCGDNPGALNYHFRAAGGQWTWAEVETEHIASMSELLGEPVHHVSVEHFPFPDGSFDRVVVIDVHEHVKSLGPLNREIARVTAPGGLVVLTTPNGDTRMPVAVVKRLLGMTPEVYGHQVQGYTTEQLESMAQAVGLRPEARGAYSKFFTESIELVINFGYVKVLSREQSSERREGEIAPSTSNELKRVGGAYRLYSILHPVLHAISRLDRLIPGRGGYAVAVAARKPA